MSKDTDTPVETATETVDAAVAAVDAAPAAPTREAAPDRLSNNPRSAHFDMAALQRGIGISFKGVERRDVEEYSVSEGWIRVAAGKSRDRFGQPMTIKLSGPVEAWFESEEPDA